MIANTATRYGTVTKTFHWLTALLILALIPLGIIANDLPYDTAEQLARKAWLFSLHKTLGVAVFAVALARIAWALVQEKPAPLHPDRRAETFLAELVHWLLYGSLVLVPLSGWVHHAATEGFAPIWWPFGQSLPFVPKDAHLAEIAAALHIIFERVLVVSILLHLAGALKHALVDRDGTLARMWFGRTEAGRAAAHRPGATAPLTALGIWAGALAVGGVLGLFSHDEEARAAALAAVSSDWTVEEGTLAIEVQQLGSPVRGQFADWTAAIAFDPESGTGRTEVTVAIGSLTLGSVTAQALGPDYLDAAGYELATFAADIRPEGDAFVADGTLTLKDITVPATLPFALTLDGQTAQMEGSLTLDRRDFEVGMSQDAANLGFEVPVTVALTATRP